jgi:hypothetical protein
VTNSVDVPKAPFPSIGLELRLTWPSDSLAGEALGHSGRPLSEKESSNLFSPVAQMLNTSLRLIRPLADNSSQTFAAQILTLVELERPSGEADDPLRDYSRLQTTNLRPLERGPGTVPVFSKALEILPGGSQI